MINLFFFYIPLLFFGGNFVWVFVLSSSLKDASYFNTPMIAFLRYGIYFLRYGITDVGLYLRCDARAPVTDGTAGVEQ